MPELSLSGCSPEPLMSYLKALGVFRIVAEQADPNTAASWTGDRLVLQTKFDHDGLVNFFLNDYQPTPIIGPWGARSGFYPGSSESSAREALDAILAAAPRQIRLASFRDMIVGMRELLTRNKFTEKVRDEDKLTLMRKCRNELPDSVLPWLDAVFILTDDSRKFPALLGTGGNEGSGSYVSTFAQVVVSLLVNREFDEGVATALFGDPGSKLCGLAVGHFNPGAIGGANSSQGFSGGGGVNLWDYLLALEGCLVFAGSAARRLGSDTFGRASYPFCVEAVAVGYASESDKEAGESTRAELWLPLWAKPITASELTQLFSEGRAQLGRHQARNAVEFALAACTLGVSRGIDAFVRYAFVMRNGLSYFAAPLGRVAVRPRPSARLLEDHALTGWLHQLRLACRDKEQVPGRYQAALRGVDRAMFEFANRAESGAEADRRALTGVLLALGRAERILSGGLRFCDEKHIRPLQGLDPQWLEQAYDGSAEFRLAAAIASIRPEKGIGSFRVFLEPVEAHGSRYAWNHGSTSAVWSNRGLAENLAAVFRRRLMESFRAGRIDVPLASSRTVPVADVVAFLREEVDDEKLSDLIWGLAAIMAGDPNEPAAPDDGIAVPFEFGLPRLLVEPLALRPSRDPDRWIPSDRGAGYKTTPDSAVFQALGRDVPSAVNAAARRLKADGLVSNGYRNRQQSSRPLEVTSLIRPVRLLAAMLFPLSERDLVRVANTVLYPPETDE